MTAGTVSAVDALLLRAAQVLSGELRTGSANPNRTACWIARRALELLVAELMRSRSMETGTATMRSLLICLSVAYRDHPDRVVAAASAWDQLSAACHQHAYELAPTHADAARLVDVVRHLARSTEPPST